MNARVLLIVAAVVGVSFGADAAGPVPMNWTVNGTQRHALVFAPSSNKGKVPLVLAFHGHGGTMQTAARAMGIHNVWREAVVVYLQGLPTPTLIDPQGSKSGWQLEPGQLGDRDLNFVDAVLKTMHEKYSIDDSRIYATGFSNGGSFSYFLWAQRPQIFAAIGSCAGRVATSVHLTEPKPVIQISGQADQVNPFEAQTRGVELVRHVNGCDAEGTQIGNGGTFFRSSRNAPVEWFVHPGGHVYPPGTSLLIVKFFKEHRKGEG